MDCLNRVRMIRPDLLTAMLLFYPGDPNEQLDPIVAAGHPLVHPYEPRVDGIITARSEAVERLLKR